MKLLFLSNFYPPVGQGGYEQWCQEAAEGLTARGHQVAVLTSRSNRNRVDGPEAAWVHRELSLEMEFSTLVHGIRFFFTRGRREKENLRTLRSLVQAFAPDGALVWGMWNLHRSLAAAAEVLLPGRVVYFVADYWPTLPSQHRYYWLAPASHWFTGVPKRILRPAALRLMGGGQPAYPLSRAIFPSRFLKDELWRRGVEPQETRIIYGGIDAPQFLNGHGAGRSQKDRPLSLLYAGRLTQEKGVDTAVCALAELVHRLDVRDVSLTIAGSGDPEYEALLRRLVDENALGPYVRFLGAQPKEAMPALYKAHDVFLFTSIWQEPFGRVLVEAQASGVVVVGTATGGAAEIIQECETGLTFSPGDAAGLAEQIYRLHHDPVLRAHLVEKGKQTALAKFDLERMIDELEEYLLSVVGRT